MGTTEQLNNRNIFNPTTLQMTTNRALLGLSWVSLVAQMIKNLPAVQETEVQSLGGKMPWRREWLPTPVFLPGEFHGQRSLVGYSSQVWKSQICLSNLKKQYDVIKT